MSAPARKWRMNPITAGKAKVKGKSKKHRVKAGAALKLFFPSAFLLLPYSDGVDFSVERDELRRGIRERAALDSTLGVLYCLER